MSTTVDQRVVEMRFDNRDFESNVSTSMSTLEKLKQKLALSGATKGFENVDAAAKKVNLTGIGSAVETISTKFSALEVMAVTTLANITNSAVNYGKRIVSALTIDPIKTGFAEYETQINAVQTILANTQSKGTTLDDVNSALDELNQYADKTIYNFTEMTRNIGTFTAAGIELETAVSAIQGIANLAAVSGSTSQQASTAMYQLSQALAAGKVTLMDWNSVVNAGMGGEVFQNALKETARAQGIAVDDIIATYGSFRESITKGAWITTEVLTETLSKFTTSGVNEYLAKYTNLSADIIAKKREEAIATGDTTAAYKELAKSLAENCDLTEDQIFELLNMSTTAEDAATKVKTFTQLFDTLKEAAQSGWTQTWEIIVGDFEEAKTLLTEVSDAFGAVINESSKARNDLLEGALGTQAVDTKAWEKLAKDTGVATEAFQKALTDTAREHNISIDSMIESAGSFEGTLKEGWLTTDLITETLSKFTGEVNKGAMSLEEFEKVANDVIYGAYGDGEERVKALTEAGYDYATVQSYVNHILEGTEFDMSQLSDTQLEMTGYTEEQIAALRELAKQAEETGTPINELMESMNKPTGRELLIDTFRNILKGIAKVLKQVRDAWQKTFPPMTSDQLYSIIEKIHALSAGFILTDDSADNLRKTFEGLFAVIDIITTVTGGALKFGIKLLCKLLGMADVDILSLTASIGEAVVKFRDWLFEGNLLAKALDKLVGGIKTAITAIKDWFKAFMELPIVKENVARVKNAFIVLFDNLKKHFGEGIEKIKEFIERVKNMDSISLSDVKDIFKDFKDNVIGHFFNIEGKFDGVKDAIKGFKDSVKEYFKEVGVDLESLKTKFLNFVKTIKEKFTSNIGGILAVGTGIGILVFVKKLSDAVVSLAKPLVSLGNFIEQLGTSIGKLVKAKAFKTNTEGILNLAIALGVLAASIAVLTLLDQNKLWSSVGALAVLAVILVALSAALRLLNKVGDTGNASLTLIAMAASVLILVFALKKMEEINKDTLLRNVGALALLMIGLGAAVGILGRLAPKLSTGAVTLLAFAVAVKILISCIKQLDGIDADGVDTTMTVLMGAMAGLAIVSAALKNVKLGGAVAVLAVVVALNILISSFEKIAELDVGKMRENIDAFIAIFGVFAGLMVASHLAGDNAIKAGVSILAMSAALVIIVSAIKMMAKVDPLDLDRGLDTVIALMAVFTAVVAVSKFAGNNAAKAGAMLLMMSAALLIVCGALALLTYLDPAKLEGALHAVVVLELVFAALIAVSGLAKDCKGTIIALTVAIGMLVVALGLLTLIDPAKLETATICLSAVLGVFALVVAATGLAKSATSTLIVLTAAIVAIGAVLYLLAEQPYESAIGAAAALSLVLISLAASVALIGSINSVSASALVAAGLMLAIVALLAQLLAHLCKLDIGPTLEIATSLSVLLVSLSASCLLLAQIKSGSIVGAIEGIGIMVVLIAAMGALMVAIGGLSELFPGMESLIDKGLPLLSKIGYGIGDFVGSIVGGLMDGVVSGLPAIGQHLSDFWTNARVFFDGVKGIDTSALQGVANVAATILMLTAADLLNSVTSWLTGGSSIVEFGDQLVPFGISFAAFAKTIKDVDPDVVNASSNAAKSLAELASNIPNQGGLISWLTGDNTLAQFAEGLVPFGNSFAAYANTVKDLDPEVITSSANAATAIAEFANKIPNQGGKLAEWLGDNTLAQFAEGLAAFGPKIKEYGDSVDGLKVDAVTSSATAAMAIAELADNLPNCGGVLADWLGDNTLSQFAIELSNFGPELMKYANSVDGLKSEAVVNSANAAMALAELADNLPNQGGVLAEWLGDNTLAQFAEGLIPFGLALRSYAINLYGLKPEIVTNSANAAMALAELADNLPNQGGVVSWFTGDNSLGKFAEGLVPFGEAFADYAKKMKDVDPGIVTTSANAASSIVALAKSLPKEDTIFTSVSTLKDFGKQLGTFGEKFADYYEHIKHINTTILSNVVAETENLVDLAKGMSSVNTDGMKSFGLSLKKLGETGVGDFIKAFTDASSKVTTAATTMVTTFEDGALSKQVGLNKSFDTLVKGVLTTIKNKYSEFKSSAESALDKFISGVNSKESAAKRAITTICSEILYVIKTKYSEFVTVGQKTMNKFVSGINAALPTPKSVYESCIEDMIKYIKSRYADFKSAGSYLVDGFVAGINANSYKARAQASAMAAAAAKAAEDELDINSPSKVFYGIGDNSGKGFINALIDSQSESYNAGKGIAESAKCGLQRAISKIVDVVEDNVDTQPTIRPVLDLSNVETGARKLSTFFGRTQALHISADMNRDTNDNIQNGVTPKTGGNTYQFTQNNYSPKALSRVEIYRQTKNQFSAMERMVEA